MLKPPLGMVPYLAGHNHFETEDCPGSLMCPYAQWKAHVERWGNPYDRVNTLQGDLASLAKEHGDLVAYVQELERERGITHA